MLKSIKWKANECNEPFGVLHQQTVLLCFVYKKKEKKKARKTFQSVCENTVPQEAQGSHKGLIFNTAGVEVVWVEVWEEIIGKKAFSSSLLSLAYTSKQTLTSKTI